MKKLTSMLLALALVLSLAACGGAASSSVASSAASSEAVPEAASEAASSEEAKELSTTDALRIAGLKGPTTMGLVNLLSMEEDGTASMDYDLQLYGAADEIVPLLMKGELDMAAIPANLAATLYQKTEGGIQAADKPNDSPAQHFLDAYGGGHFAAQKDLLCKLVMDAPEAIQWLSGLGVEFDKAPDGAMITTHGGGTSRKRMHAAKDYSGAEIMRTLRDEVLNHADIQVVDFTSAIELIKDEQGRCAGAVLLNMETKELLVARAKTVILATGGAGRLHYQGFPTSNHYGATADGLILGYRAGARLLYPDTLQYHPTGAAFPAQIFGALVTEKVRSVGAMLINAEGEAFMNPLETRDVAAASIIRECSAHGKGVKTPLGDAVWLDTPMIELKHGAGTIEKRIPAMMRMFAKHGIDIRTEPILVYPTLHYQNGGLHITVDGQTDVENLFAAGEVVGGIHGRNRLMGNSLLDVIVFGRNAGQHAAEKAKTVTTGTLTLAHVAAFEAERAAAGIADGALSPQLLPDYTRKVNP